MARGRKKVQAKQAVKTMYCPELLIMKRSLREIDCLVILSKLCWFVFVISREVIRG